MPAAKENNIQIRQFKDKSSHWFVNYAHYYLNENNELLWAAGESDNKEYRDVLEAYIKRNKKTYVPREIVAEKEYFEVVNFGEHKGRKVPDIPLPYLRWMIKSYNFKSGEEKLKQEIIEYLK